MTIHLPVAGGIEKSDPPAQAPCTTGAILSLRPTQFAVGFGEVSEKMKKLEAGSVRQLSVVIGPERQPYLHDGHHYAVALCRMGIEHAGMTIVDDLSHLNQDAFWLTMEQRCWVRPIDGMGVQRQIGHMPADVLAMQDDPFRSLAGALRRLGYYAKTSMPYADFAWADFLRRRIARECVESDFEAALIEAVRLIGGDGNERHLPGWQDLPGAGTALPHPPQAIIPPP